MAATCSDQSSAFDRLAVVLDCGSGYSKLGFAGNSQPAFVLPTTLTQPSSASRLKSGRTGLQATPCVIGVEPTDLSEQQLIHCPIRHGLVTDWDALELFWQQSFFRYLHVNPEDHAVVLPAPLSSMAEHTDKAAEIMFETFNVPALHVASQAELGMYASSLARLVEGDAKLLTGLVIDCGHGLTSMTPVVEGYVIQSAAKSLPFAGAGITASVQSAMRERGEPVPPHMAHSVARAVKEKRCVVVSDAARESQAWQADAARQAMTYEGINSQTQVKPRHIAHPSAQAGFSCRVGPEAFMAPELLLAGPKGAKGMLPLPQLAEEVICSCPIDARRALYRNIVLCGGTSRIPNLAKRLQRDLKRLVDARVGSAAKVEVYVVAHKRLQHAVWMGGSLLGKSPGFPASCTTQATYAETGSMLARKGLLWELA